MDIIDPAVIVEKFNEFFVNIGLNLAAYIRVLYRINQLETFCLPLL